MKTLLLLHGAIGSSEQLLPLSELLSAHFKVHMLNFSGHGGNTFPAAPFSIPLLATEVLTYIEQQKLEKISIFGYSMGGYVAAYLAKHHTDRVEKIATLATKFHWDADTAAKEVKMLDPEKIAEKLPRFAETLKHRHAPNDWKTVLTRTTEMMLAMGNDNPLKTTDYSDISTPCLVMLGDRDKMVGLDETVAVYKALPNGFLSILPGTPHPIEQVDELAVSLVLKTFFCT